MESPPDSPSSKPLRDTRRSSLQKYQDLVVGSRSLGRLLLYELGGRSSTSWVPGALGLVLRRVAYPLAARARSAATSTFGQGVVLRHPHKIHLGDDVVVDDLVRARRQGRRPTAGIRVGNGVFLGRGTILSCKDGDIALGDHVNIGFHSEIFSGSRSRSGRYGLFAAYTYLVGGGHAFDAARRARDRAGAHVARASRWARTSGWARAPR